MTDTLAPAAASLPAGVSRLPEWGLIRARGADAAVFLQGQLTNDVQSLREGEARLAGYCSAKGRLLASFVVWKSGPEELLLACSADLLPTTLKRLSMFVLRAKCQLTDASAELPLWGLCGPAEASPLDATQAPWSVTRLDDNGQAIRLPDVHGHPRWLLACASQNPPLGLAEVPPEGWRWLEVASGVVRIVQATAELFVPQMVNWELVGGVSFKKGCYPGQEVVARSQYRGTLKRRGSLLASPVPLAAGQEVFQLADPEQPAGTVALAAALPSGQHLALVELKRAALALGDLHLGSAQGALLQALPLPYEVPQDEQ